MFKEEEREGFRKSRSVSPLRKERKNIFHNNPGNKNGDKIDPPRKYEVWLLFQEVTRPIFYLI